MSKYTDQNYLRNQQYQNSANLNARIQLHERFSANKQGWHRFVFDHLLALPPQSSILEIGCGPAKIWTDNLDRLPEGWQITLSDFSPGMIEDARRNLADATSRFRFEVLDVQDIRFPAETFDAVIANHMLYHVPDRHKALSEIYRVLKPNGRFFAATNGFNQLRELHELGARYELETGFSANQMLREFNLENGQEQLAQFFPNLTMHRYEDSLEVTEVQPILDYILSTHSPDEPLPTEKLAEVTQFLEQEIASKGAFHIEKDTGLFIAIKS